MGLYRSMSEKVTMSDIVMLNCMEGNWLGGCSFLRKDLPSITYQGHATGIDSIEIEKPTRSFFSILLS